MSDTARTESILWRRLDSPGHDACRLVERDGAWRLEGAAAFMHDGVPTSLAYEIACDADWRTTVGEVHGWIGPRALDFRVTRTPDGGWTLNDRIVPDLGGCVHLDLGFTPATNLAQLRHAALRIGEVADVPVAWLDVVAGTLDLLQQRYERRSEETYWYEAPRFDYFALLRVDDAGFVEQYPGLWEAERAT